MVHRSVLPSMDLHQIQSFSPHKNNVCSSKHTPEFKQSKRKGRRSCFSSCFSLFLSFYKAHIMKFMLKSAVLFMTTLIVPALAEMTLSNPQALDVPGTDNFVSHRILRSADQRRPSRKLNIDTRVVNGSKLWPEYLRADDGKIVIPFVLEEEEDFSDLLRETVFGAIDMVAEVGVVDFEKVTWESDFFEEDIVTIKLDMATRGCSASTVGYEENPIITIGQRCVNPGQVAHELLHVLGFHHENSRSDRDEFVQVNEENILTGYLGQFAKLDTDSLGSPYDYGSIMHYEPHELSIDEEGYSKPTLTLLQYNPEKYLTPGQVRRLSHEDKMRLRYLYQCSSGPRTAEEYQAEPCSADCPCWEGAMETCNGDNDCQGGLQCSSKPVDLNPGCPDALLFSEKEKRFKTCSETKRDPCTFLDLIDACRGYCGLPCLHKPEQPLPDRMCLYADGEYPMSDNSEEVPSNSCVYGHPDEETGDCICFGGNNGSQNGYCLDDDGACTIPKAYDQLSREFYCGPDKPSDINGCSSDDDCTSGSILGVCIEHKCDGANALEPKAATDSASMKREVAPLLVALTFYLAVFLLR